MVWWLWVIAVLLCLILLYARWLLGKELEPKWCLWLFVILPVVSEFLILIAVLLYSLYGRIKDARKAKRQKRAER